MSSFMLHYVQGAFVSFLRGAVQRGKLTLSELSVFFQEVVHVLNFLNLSKPMNLLQTGPLKPVLKAPLCFRWAGMNVNVLFTVNWKVSGGGMRNQAADTCAVSDGGFQP